MSAYNGWTNYETWRVNLEFFDGMAWSDFMEEYDEEFHEEEEVVGDMAGRLQMHVEEVAYHNTADNLFAVSLVDDFLRKVYWDEIARVMFGDATRVTAVP
jgi:hypothetical protein